MRNQHFILRIAAAGLALAVTSTAVAGQRQAMSDALFTGPLDAPNATSLPAGHWDVEPYLLDAIQYGSFDDSWNEHDAENNSHAYRSVTLLEYGLTDRFLVALLPQFGFNDTDNGQSSNGVQLGDTTLRMQYMLTEFHPGSLLPTTAFALSEVFPTGRYDGLGDNPANGFGSGLLTTKIGLYSQDYFWMPNGRILRARLDLSYAIPDEKASVTGVSVYGTGKGFNGRIDNGKTFSADLAFEYSLTRHWVPAVDVVYSHSGGSSIRGTQASNGLVTPISEHAGSSESVNVAPALEYNWNSHYGVIAGADVAVAGRNTAATVTPQAALNIYY